MKETIDELLEILEGYGMKWWRFHSISNRLDIGSLDPLKFEGVTFQGASFRDCLEKAVYLGTKSREDG